MNTYGNNNRGKRSGIERRKFSYHIHIPEKRTGLDERSGKDRRNLERYNTPIAFYINKE